jgi:Protein of unknown function (DUF3788)
VSDTDLPPVTSEVARTLGRARSAFERLAAPGDGVTAEWRRYGKASPWTLKVIDGRRTLYYLTPEEAGFMVAVILGERATATALASNDIPEPIKQALRDARPYAEGRGIRVPVRESRDVAVIERLVAIKLDPR